MKWSNERMAGAFICGLFLGVVGGLFLAQEQGRHLRVRLAKPLADLYHDLEPRLVAVPMDDIILCSRIRSALQAAGLKEDVALNVQGRRVYLRGTTRDAEMIQRVESIVRAIPGVREIVNELIQSPTVGNSEALVTS